MSSRRMWCQSFRFEKSLPSFHINKTQSNLLSINRVRSARWTPDPTEDEDANVRKEKKNLSVPTTELTMIVESELSWAVVMKIIVPLQCWSVHENPIGNQNFSHRKKSSSIELISRRYLIMLFSLSPRDLLFNSSSRVRFDEFYDFLWFSETANESSLNDPAYRAHSQWWIHETYQILSTIIWSRTCHVDCKSLLSSLRFLLWFLVVTREERRVLKFVYIWLRLVNGKELHKIRDLPWLTLW